MICNVCRLGRCECNKRTLVRFFVGAVLVVVSAVGAQWVWESRPHPTCNVSSQGTCFGNPNIQNGVTR